MTETETKLVDARVQLELAETNGADFERVRSCINAFISSARSVTFAMQKESSGSKEFDAWYAAKQAEMKANPMLRFFHEQRTISIHERSVRPNQRTVPILHVSIGGRIVGTGGTVMTYEFNEYRDYVPEDNGNVFRISKQYYSYLEQLVEEWLILGR